MDNLNVKIAQPPGVNVSLSSPSTLYAKNVNYGADYVFSIGPEIANAIVKRDANGYANFTTSRTAAGAAAIYATATGGSATYAIDARGTNGSGGILAYSSGNGKAIYAIAVDGIGVNGSSSTGRGVSGSSTSGVGTYGASVSSIGGILTSQTSTGAEINSDSGTDIAVFQNGSTDVVAVERIDGVLRWNKSGYIGRLTPPILTANRTWTLPNASGTLLLDSAAANFVDLSSAQTITGAKWFQGDLQFGYTTPLNLTFSNVNFIEPGSNIKNQFKTAFGFGSAANNATSDFVGVTGAQTVDGVKTFNSTPLVPNLTTSSSSTSAVNKAYVDNVATSIHVHEQAHVILKTATLAAATGGSVAYTNGTAGVGAKLTVTGGSIIITALNSVCGSDGDLTSGVNGSRVVIAGESNSAWNGIYTISADRELTRAIDFDAPVKMSGGDFVFVTHGTTYADTGWICSEPVSIVGTSPVIFLQFSGAGTYDVGTGLTRTGTIFSITNTGVNATSTTYGGASSIPVITVNPQGQITSVTPTAIASDTSKANLSGAAFTGNVSTTTNFSGPLTGNVTGNVTGTAASFTGSLSGDVTGTQSATVISAATVTGKALTGYVSGSGTISATDTILSAINKLNGNDALKATLASPTFTGTVTLPVGTAAVAPLKLATGINLTTAVFGSVEFDGTNLYLTNNSATPTRKTIAFTDSALATGAVGSSQLASGLTLGGTTTGTFSGPLTGNVTGNVTGSAASFTGSLVGDVTGTQAATAIAAATVTGKALTGYVSGSGVVSATDTILSAINKLNGNDALKATLASPTFTGTVTSPAFSGALTGNVTGNVTGTAASFTGNLTGDVTSTGMSTTVVKINGTSLASLGTGILKNTTTTGVPSIAVAADFPTLNQNTAGNAATVTGFSPTTAKTLSVTNTLTLSGTDSSTLNIGTGGTLGTAAYTASSAYVLKGGNTDAATLTVGTTDANNISLITNNTAKVTITSAGRVGIGMTPDEANTNRSALQILQSPSSIGGITLRSSITDATNQTVGISMGHYSAGWVAFTLFQGTGTISANTVNIGGSNGDTPAATEVATYAAANTTTTAGTKIISVTTSGMNVVTGSVGIGTASPASTSILELSSTTKGFLPPRLSTTQRDAITTPADGLVVYNSTQGALNTYNGTLSAWQSLLPVPSSLVVPISSGGTSSTTAAGARTALDVPSLTLANSFAGSNTFNAQVELGSQAANTTSSAMSVRMIRDVSHYTRDIFKASNLVASGVGPYTSYIATTNASSLEGSFPNTAATSSYLRAQLSRTPLFGDSSGSVGVDFRVPFVLYTRMRFAILANTEVLVGLAYDTSAGEPTTGGAATNAGLKIYNNSGTVTAHLWKQVAGTVTTSVDVTTGALSSIPKTGNYSNSGDILIWLENTGTGTNTLNAYMAFAAAGTAIPVRPTTPLCTITGIANTASVGAVTITSAQRITGALTYAGTFIVSDAKFTEL